jgi:hypothetical protein
VIKIDVKKSSNKYLIRDWGSTREYILFVTLLVSKWNELFDLKLLCC